METSFVFKVSNYLCRKFSSTMKEEILRKATEMFLTLGFKSVTMDDIATEMGISKKTIYQHFDNKPELVEAVAISLFKTISSGIDCICELGKNAIEEIFEIKNFMMKQLKNENTSPIHQLNKYFPKVAENLRSNQFCKMQQCVNSNLTRGKAAGLYREEIEIDFITRIYYVGGAAIKDEDIFPRDQFPIADVVEKYLEYHLRAIATPAGLEVLQQLISNKPNITTHQ